MKKESRKPSKLASKAAADDFELSLVATIAALLKNGDHELTFERAAVNALDLLGACKKELDERRQPRGPNLRYKEAVKRITGRTEERFDRIDEAFRNFVANHPSGIVHMFTGEPEFDPTTERLMPQLTEEDISRALDDRRVSGFSEKEITSLEGAYSRWTSRKPRPKKN